MIWATVNSRSCSCWLYRVSPSLAAKNIINLILVLTILWCPCVVTFWVVGNGCFLWLVRSLDKTISLRPASFCTPRPNFPVNPGISWRPTFAFQSSMMKRLLFLMLVLEGVIGLHRSTWASLHQWLEEQTWITVMLICLGNKPRSFGHFWGCTQVLHFGLLLTTRATPFVLRDSYPQQ